jgi:ABC-2 type transport system ATP-binding protein
VTGLTKRYGEVEAVRGIDFQVERGETFGFLGPNGAGKTTTIKILCTLARAASGSAFVAGHDVGRERDAVRRDIGLVFQDTTLDGYVRSHPTPVAVRSTARCPLSRSESSLSFGLTP